MENGLPRGAEKHALGPMAGSRVLSQSHGPSLAPLKDSVTKPLPSNPGLVTASGLSPVQCAMGSLYLNLPLTLLNCVLFLLQHLEYLFQDLVQALNTEISLLRLVLSHYPTLPPY